MFMTLIFTLIVCLTVILSIQFMNDKTSFLFCFIVFLIAILVPRCFLEINKGEIIHETKK